MVQISLACEAHSSPRINCLVAELNFGLEVKRAAMAHTERTNTGGSVSFLQCALAVTFRIINQVKGRN